MPGNYTLYKFTLFAPSKIWLWGHPYWYCDLEFLTFYLKTFSSSWIFGIFMNFLALQVLPINKFEAVLSFLLPSRSLIIPVLLTFSLLPLEGKSLMCLLMPSLIYGRFLMFGGSIIPTVSLKGFESCSIAFIFSLFGDVTGLPCCELTRRGLKL